MTTNYNINDPKYDKLREKKEEELFSDPEVWWDEETKPVVGFIHPLFGAGIYE